MDLLRERCARVLRRRPSQSGRGILPREPACHFMGSLITSLCLRALNWLQGKHYGSLRQLAKDSDHI